MKRKDILYYIAGALVIAGSILLVVSGRLPSFTQREIRGDLAIVTRERDPLTVVSVYDGDTITLADGRNIRYLGINTTEIGETFSEEARVANRDLVLGKVVRLELDEQTTDSYGRTLAFVWVNGTNVNLELIRKGLAHLLYIPPNRKHYDEFLAAQKEAQTQGRGFWSLKEFQVPVRITSFHPDRGYMRLVNISSETVPLGGWTAENDLNQRYTFPAVSLHPGFSLVFNFGKGEDQLDPENPQVYWGLEQAKWDRASASVTIRAANGTLIGFKSAPH
ncbi:MAG: thermonuclease family protein [bacterium JZ-2024 1]